MFGEIRKRSQLRLGMLGKQLATQCVVSPMANPRAYSALSTPRRSAVGGQSGDPGIALLGFESGVQSLALACILVFPCDARRRMDGCSVNWEMLPQDWSVDGLRQVASSHLKENRMFHKSLGPASGNQQHVAVGQKQWYHFGVGAPPILVYFSGWIGMFTGGTIWILTHGHVSGALFAPGGATMLMLQALLPSMLARSLAEGKEVEVVFKGGTNVCSPPGKGGAARWKTGARDLGDITRSVSFVSLWLSAESRIYRCPFDGLVWLEIEGFHWFTWALCHPCTWKSGNPSFSEQKDMAYPRIHSHVRDPFCSVSLWGSQSWS